MKRFRVLTAALFAAVLLCGFSATAYAGGGEEFMDGTGGYDPDPPVAEEPEPEPNPFTPEGTGTVVDNATDGDGKEFFTITTPNENIFYLVIDRQRSGENVYFLNAVTDVDAPGIVVPFVFDGQTHAVKQHPIEQLGVRGKVLKAGVGDKLAGDAEVGKLHRLVAIKIVW